MRLFRNLGILFFSIGGFLLFCVIYKWVFGQNISAKFTLSSLLEKSTFIFLIVGGLMATVGQSLMNRSDDAKFNHLVTPKPWTKFNSVRF